ncbi:FAD/NAD-P-binding domain-containing protein [Lentinula detonsa]|uniref:FAD/NAD-P-binding domain-containing protein n=1 Tax=Lentinula detonsa TaxID=2804962 RepID=A0A9W8TZI4_9AGAR|nr:FAD/NAD-P-binding domain-containing protein [Lentinula detonsa]
MELSDVRIERTENLVPKRLCIIGAGPAGLAALKIILDTPQYQSGAWVPVAYETRDQVGGVCKKRLPALSTADDLPFSPLYDSLTTNLPHPVMAYTSFPFPPETPVFPPARVVETYLKSYAKMFNLLPHIQLNTSVDTVERLTDGQGQWKVKLSSEQIEVFDFLIVCNGHYRVPRYPEIPGLESWRASNHAMHSAWYRRPTHKYGDKVLVIGAGPSGLDISSEMAENGVTIIHSIRENRSEDLGNIKRRGSVIEFKDNGVVLFEDGTVEEGISFCIIATGYETTFPFLPEPAIIRNTLPPPIPPIPQSLYNSTFHVFPLAKHIFPLGYTNPNIAFLGLLVRVAPFPLLEAQARATVHVFANPSTLDYTREAVDIMSRYADLSSELASEDPLMIARVWHRFTDYEQFDYRDSLYEFSDASTQEGITGIEGRIVVPDWEKKMYDAKGVLRQFWIYLEKEGLAEVWLRGVGKGGIHEWVELLERMLRDARENGGESVKEDTLDADKSKL